MKHSLIIFLDLCPFHCLKGEISPPLNQLLFTASVVLFLPECPRILFFRHSARESITRTQTVPVIYWIELFAFPWTMTRCFIWNYIARENCFRISIKTELSKCVLSPIRRPNFLNHLFRFLARNLSVWPGSVARIFPMWPSSWVSVCTNVYFLLSSSLLWHSLTFARYLERIRIRKL